MRENSAVARCTVERLMQQMGLQGAVRGRTFKTTIAQDGAVRPADLAKRHMLSKGWFPQRPVENHAPSHAVSL